MGNYGKKRLSIAPTDGWVDPLRPEKSLRGNRPIFGERTEREGKRRLFIYRRTQQWIHPILHSMEQVMAWRIEPTVRLARSPRP